LAFLHYVINGADPLKHHNYFAYEFITNTLILILIWVHQKY